MRQPAGLKSYLKWGVFLVLPLYILDQLSKWYVNKHIIIGDVIEVIPGFFELLHVRNTGVGFGLLQDLPIQFRVIFFLVFTLAACGVIIYISRQVKDNESVLMKIFLSLILAGAMGNLTDRMLRFEVIDFFYWHILNYVCFPNFNVADVFLTIGMAGLLIFMLRRDDSGTGNNCNADEPGTDLTPADSPDNSSPGFKEQ